MKKSLLVFLFPVNFSIEFAVFNTNSGVTERVQGVRVDLSEKKVSEVKAMCFLMKAVCIYIKNLKEKRHKAFLEHHRPQK